MEDRFIEVTEDIDDLRSRVEKNEVDLEGKIQKVIDKRAPLGGTSSGELDKRINAVLTQKFKSSRAFLRGGVDPTRVERSREDRKDEAYWNARRSFRMWPIRGDDLYDATCNFLVDFLKQEPCSLPRRDELVIRKAGSSDKPKDQDEAIVRFPDVSTRDMIRSAAFNLAGRRAGIRLEIPDKLRPSLRALESVAFNLKKTNPGMKRNIKFDDEVLDLVMDVKMQDHGEWKKIRPGQAMKARTVRRESEDAAEEMSADELGAFMSASASGSGPATGANAQPQGS